VQGEKRFGQASFVGDLAVLKMPSGEFELVEEGIGGGGGRGGGGG
jgi:hypothetical protein